MAIIQVTQILPIDVEEAPCNPVALYWLNKFGNWDMWVFARTQTKGVDVDEGEEFERNFDALEPTVARSEFITKTEIPQIVLGYSNLPTNKVEGIKGILSSPKVLMLVSDPPHTPPKFLGVKVEPGSFTLIETSEKFHNLEFTISLPEQFNQEQ